MVSKTEKKTVSLLNKQQSLSITFIMTLKDLDGSHFEILL